MKETLKKVFDKSVLAVIVSLIIFVLIFQFIVFPGLTAADTYINIVSFLIGLISVLFVYHYIQWKDLIDFILGKDDVLVPGETELDYLPKEEIVKKKPTKKKPIKKRTSEVTTPKVLGEHQIKKGKPSIKPKNK